MKEVKKILFITLSNIGDVVLTLPALDELREYFPNAQISVMTARRPSELFGNNPHIKEVIVFDKRAKLRDKIELFNKLKAMNFDMAIDLRNTFFGIFLPARYKLPIITGVPGHIRHMQERHLYKVRSLLKKLNVKKAFEAKESLLFISPQDKLFIKGLLLKNGIAAGDNLIVIAPGAKSHTKRWAKEKFCLLIPHLVKEFKAKIVLAGDRDDIKTSEYITANCKYPVLDLTGKTNLSQLAYLLMFAKLLVTNDSATLHLGSYLNIPVVSIFGPTDQGKYGPWSANCAAVRKEILCRPCEKAQCRLGTLECIHLVKVEDVLGSVRRVLSCKVRSMEDKFKRILIVRTDRIGDVLLSTPVIKAMRKACPNAFIAMMVSPYALDIVEGNPYLDQVIIYDKDEKHKSWVRSIKFTLNLKKKKFDLALVLHPINRVHLITFFAGIPHRIGYGKKMGFLLSKKFQHSKQLGEKHELEYSLDLVRYLGIEPSDLDLFMPIKKESEKLVDDLFVREGIAGSDRLLAIHPGASCPSKIWPNQRFAEVADSLAKEYGFKVLVVAGPKDMTLAQSVVGNMKAPVVNLAGRTSVSELASVLKRCTLFISNDSGPVHIASAVGTPVISIFGRSQAGLSPKRWGPIGKNDRILHEEVGCIECLAHNCKREFACLKAITVDDVIKAAWSILASPNNHLHTS
ncbi:MAG: lipopolysaccharide heptosyltransferase II [Candidatus Omnitrophica bacterium]|nr:lipopolysaccharide heptosyltransferase II [Candidatus Omnitrophota bacterium]MBU1869989.1 lipopolysaccharide heptosyltransferase II [Candidatus Omnitrophota bacterium]